MSEKQFAKGVKITTKITQYGEIIKVGINVSDFCEGNLINERGYINFDIKKGKSGNWYQELNTYGQDLSKNNLNNEENIVDFDEDEIPF